MCIPCMHIPALPMAAGAIEKFKEYVEYYAENNMSMEDLIKDLDGYIKSVGRG